MRLIIILILILIIFIINEPKIMEGFSTGYQMFQQFVPYYSSDSPFVPINTYKYPSSRWWDYTGVPVFNGYTDLPWNNMQMGVTSNMSYDLRGDPSVIPRIQVSPWNNPEVYPIYNNGSDVLM
jgi:hypothetical protein